MHPSFVQRMLAAQLRLLQLLQLRYATKTHLNTQNGPSPYKRPKHLYKRIDNFIVATYCTKDLSIEDTCASLLKALDLLKEACAIAVLYYAQTSSNKPKDTKTLVS